MEEVIDIMAMEEVLTIHVKLTDFNVAENGNRKVQVLAFTGTGEGNGFAGTILPGAADVQSIEDDRCELFARYMLAGKDAEGNDCTLYIDNRGIAAKQGTTVTKAHILTNCRALAGLKQPLTGVVEAVENHAEEDVLIHLYAERDA